MSRKTPRSPQIKATTKVRPPTLPQHEHPAPLSRLIMLGPDDFPETYDQIAATLKAGRLQESAAKLLEMVLDESYYDYDEDDYQGGKTGDPRAWTRLHALRVLMRLGEPAQIGIEPLLPLLNEEDDFLREEMPFYYAAMGQPAIQPLANVLRDTKADTYLRAGAGDSLAEIGEAHPELCAEIAPILEQTLLTEQEDDLVPAFLVLNLVDINARESLPIIEQAFADGRVDESVVELADVQEHFGVPVTAPRRRWNFNDEAYGEEEFEEEGTGQENETNDGEPQTPFIAPPKVGRNEPCPCGSGKKYKKCCGA